MDYFTAAEIAKSAIHDLSAKAATLKIFHTLFKALQISYLLCRFMWKMFPELCLNF